jgi:hypothetical protein
MYPNKKNSKQSTWKVKKNFEKINNEGQQKNLKQILVRTTQDLI